MNCDIGNTTSGQFLGLGGVDGVGGVVCFDLSRILLFICPVNAKKRLTLGFSTRLELILK